MKLKPLLSFVVAMLLVAAGVRAEADATVRYRETFFKLCDIACRQLAEDSLYQMALKRQHYKDAYSIRALAVAYDMTGNQRYLAACQAWSDKMLSCQSRMEPRGAYYMNYGRKPGERTGDWFAADSSSIALGVLSTAVRTKDTARREQYIRSVRDFADLVLANYVREGGITDGIWSKFDGPWWCSTGIFGSVAFLLYDETGEQRYLTAALGTVDWLNRQQYDKTGPYDLSMQGAALIMYYNEAYSTGYRHIEANTVRYAGMMAHVQESLSWMAQHRRGNSGGQRADYNAQWGSKAGGMPFHVLIWSKWFPDSAALTARADDELDYICGMIFDAERLKEDKNPLSQLMNFTMMSLAERLSPGSMYRR